MNAHTATPATIESQDFYNLMQAYRHAQLQSAAVDSYVAVIAHVDTRLAAHKELVKALEGVLRVADRATDEFDAARAALVKASA